MLLFWPDRRPRAWLAIVTILIDHVPNYRVIQDGGTIVEVMLDTNTGSQNTYICSEISLFASEDPLRVPHPSP